MAPFTEEEIRRIAEMATPDALVPAPPEAWEVAQRMAETALDAYTLEDWSYVLNAFHPERAASYISGRPPELRSELLMLIEWSKRRAKVE